MIIVLAPLGTGTEVGRGRTWVEQLLLNATFAFPDRRTAGDVKTKDSPQFTTWGVAERHQVIDFWLAFSAIVITVGRLVRKGWTHYRWEGGSCRRP
jgi:hypothetical protein